jgi:hypothetical protein
LQEEVSIALQLPTRERSDAAAETSGHRSEENFHEPTLSLPKAMQFEFQSKAHDEAAHNLAIH